MKISHYLLLGALLGTAFLWPAPESWKNCLIRGEIRLV